MNPEEFKKWKFHFKCAVFEAALELNEDTEGYFVTGVELEQVLRSFSHLKKLIEKAPVLVDLTKSWREEGEEILNEVAKMVSSREVRRGRKQLMPNSVAYSLLMPLCQFSGNISGLKRLQDFLAPRGEFEGWQKVNIRSELQITIPSVGIASKGSQWANHLRKALFSQFERSNWMPFDIRYNESRTIANISTISGHSFLHSEQPKRGLSPAAIRKLIALKIKTERPWNQTSGLWDQEFLRRSVKPRNSL